MFCFRMAFLNIKRRRRKSALIVLICILIVFFVSGYIDSIDKSERQLADLPRAVPVSARISSTDGSKVAGLVISPTTVDKIEASGLVKDLLYTAPLAANLAQMPDEQKDITICCVNKAQAIPGYFDRTITMLSGYEQSVLQGQDAVCVADEDFLENHGLSVGDTVQLAVYALKYNSDNWAFSFEPLGVQDILIAGSMTFAATARDTDINLVCPVGWSRELNNKADERFFLDSVFFNVADPLALNEFKAAMNKFYLISVVPTADYSLSGSVLSVRDETFITTASSLMNNISTLYTFAPIVFLLIALVGYVISYLMMQSRRSDIAVMRYTGTSRRACVAVMLIEFTVLGLLGSLFGLGISALILGFADISTALIAMLFFLSFIFGIIVAAVQISGVNLMTGFKKTEE